MAKARRSARKRAVAAGRDRRRAHKSVSPKAPGTGSRKPNPKKLTPQKQKPSPESETVRLKGQLKAARLQQEATAEILRTVANASGEVAGPLQQIAETTARLFEASSVAIRIAENGQWARAINVGEGSHRITAAVPRALLTIDGHNLPGTVFRENRQIHVPDLNHPDPAYANWPGIKPALEAGTRVISGTPLRRGSKAIGVLIIHRDRLVPFAPEELALQQSFADQAAIVIENARLFNETKEALERQTATADILKVIASSPSDVQPVFDAIAASANALLGGLSTAVHILTDDTLHLMAFTPTNPAGDANLQAAYPRPLSELPWGAQLRQGEIVRVGDTEIEWGALPRFRDVARMRGFRSILRVPMLRDGTTIGVINVTRAEPGQFADHHVQLLQTFADQAVIAISNVRLFQQVQERTRDLTEALTYQTGSGNILRVIASSPTEVGPVLKAIVESACELCEAYDAVVLLRDGDDLRFWAHHGPIGINLEKWPISRNWTAGRAFVDRKPVHVRDMLSEEGDDFPDSRELSQYTGTAGIHTILAVPLLRENESIGTILLRRTEVQAFNDKQIALLQTFADQAVIAIGNVHLFDEVQARTRDLSEALQFQTATSDVLKVISRSPDTLQPVLDVIVETSRHLCGTATSSIFLLSDGRFHIVALSGATPEYLQFLQANPIAPDQRGSSTARAAREKRTVHIPDISADPEFGQGHMAVGQRRALLSVPLMHEGVAIGVITMTQSYLTRFTERQIEVVQTFADQAVIAISNVRLFEQVQARTKELAASLDDLRTAQDRLIQTEKLASLGQLTAGIAHEIKNPLNFVNNFSALSAELTDELNDLLETVSLAQGTREEIDELTGMLKDNLVKVVQHGKRADSIVKNMLLHSREGAGEHRPADINTLLEESLNLAYHGARAEK
ncbi:GAF domain-containing sensor histidine kinase, partial [Bradyrhizobium sp.]|uniref:GAF domain-containing sensor histidine kinase n=1 Tax=Bradyrhizobium sp. TaxID=376 RepID=UPI003C555D71